MKNKDFWFGAGAALVLAGVILQIVGWHGAPYVFGAGAVLVFVLRLAFSFKSDDFRAKRLLKIQFISSLLLVGSIYFMFTQSNVWALMLFLAAVLDALVIWRLPKE